MNFTCANCHKNFRQRVEENPTLVVEGRTNNETIGKDEIISFQEPTYQFIENLGTEITLCKQCYDQKRFEQLLRESNLVQTMTQKDLQILSTTMDTSVKELLQQNRAEAELIESTDTEDWDSDTHRLTPLVRTPSQLSIVPGIENYTQTFRIKKIVKCVPVKGNSDTYSKRNSSESFVSFESKEIKKKDPVKIIIKKYEGNSFWKPVPTKSMKLYSAASSKMEESDDDEKTLVSEEGACSLAIMVEENLTGVEREVSQLHISEQITDEISGENKISENISQITGELLELSGSGQPPILTSRKIEINTGAISKNTVRSLQHSFGITPITRNTKDV